MVKVDETSEAINEAARKIHRDMVESGNLMLRDGAEVTFLYSTLYGIFCKPTNPKYLSRQEAFSEAFRYALAKYEPEEKDFLSHFKTVLDSRAINAYNSQNRHIENTVQIDAQRTDEDGNAMENQIEDTDTSIEETYLLREKIEDSLQLLATRVNFEKRKYSTKKTVCYSTLFFTDDISLIALDYEKWAFEIILRNSRRFDEAADIDFLNSFLTKRCGSVADIRKADYKPLSEFTGDPADNGTLCRPEKEKHIDDRVYTAYILQKYGKSVTINAVGNQRKIFGALKCEAVAPNKG